MARTALLSRTVLMILGLALAGASAARDPASPPAPAAFGSAGGGLVFTPLPPCRLLDTRQPGPRGGVIANNTERTFNGYNVNFQTAQGGANSDCGLSADVQPEALAITLVAVNPGGDGYLTAYPAGSDRPLAASLNYTAGSVASTSLILPINNDLALDEFSIYTWRAAHVVADVTGYFSRPQTARPTCHFNDTGEWTNSVPAGGTLQLSSPTCNTGYAAIFGGCQIMSPFGGFEHGSLSSSAVKDGATVCTFRNTGVEAIWAMTWGMCCRVEGR